MLRERDYTRLLGSSIAYGFGREMVFVAIGWQVYSIHKSTLDLGLVGLAEFLPLLLLALPGGQLSDRFSRRAIAARRWCRRRHRGGPDRRHDPWRPRAVAVPRRLRDAAASAVGNPATRSIWPDLVPPDLLQRALTLRNSRCSSSRCGPGARRPPVRDQQLACTPLCWAAGRRTLPIAALTRRGRRLGHLASSNLAGRPSLHRQHEMMLGVISLDLVAVLFGARSRSPPLLPASSSGRAGRAGMLRGAPAVGALAAGIMLARRPLQGGAGAEDARGGRRFGAG